MSLKIQVALESLSYQGHATNPRVLQEAAKIARTTRPTRERTREDIANDAHFGLMVEAAVLEALNTVPDCRAVYADEDDKSFDIRLLTPTSDERIDVKAMRRYRGAASFTVSGWEMEHAHPDTLYLLFDCSDGETAEFDGWFRHTDLRESKKFYDNMGRPTGYIFWDAVNAPETLHL